MKLKMLTVCVPLQIKATIHEFANMPFIQAIFAITIGFFAPIRYFVWFIFALLVIEMLAESYFESKLAVAKLEKRRNKYLGFFKRVGVFYKMLTRERIVKTIEKLVTFIILLMIGFVSDILFFKFEPAHTATNILTFTNAILGMLLILQFKSIGVSFANITRIKEFRNLHKLYSEMRSKTTKISTEPCDE